jgi:hypothetical protein
MELAQHIAHHARALHRLGATRPAERQAHALHRVQDAPLHRLLAVAHVGQRTALHDAERVLQVGLLGILRQRQAVATAAGAVVEVERGLVHRHGVKQAPGSGRKVRDRISAAAVTARVTGGDGA